MPQPAPTPFASASAQALAAVSDATVQAVFANATWRILLDSATSEAQTPPGSLSE